MDLKDKLLYTHRATHLFANSLSLSNIFIPFNATPVLDFWKMTVTFWQCYYQSQLFNKNENL